MAEVNDNHNVNIAYNADLDRNNLPLIGRLDLILSELLSLNPFLGSDEELWELVKNRDFSANHPFHCIIIKFGGIKDYPKRPPRSHELVRKIEVTYKDKTFLKNLTEFCFALKDSHDKKLSSRIITPWYFHDYFSFITLDNISKFLENKECLLLYSIKGKNKYSKEINAWTLVELKDNIKENASILREYLHKAQECALWELCEAPNSFFDFDIPEFIKEGLLKRLKDEYIERRYRYQAKFIPKTLGPSRKKKTTKLKGVEDYYELEYHEESSNDDSYLDDELDYIRQNGGEWIDD